MSLPMIILGLLDQPRTGYALKKLFAGTLAHFWSAETNQIYPALKRLESEGLLSSREQHSPIGPKRRMYKRTRAGRQALINWLEEPPVEPRNHIPYLAQVFFLKDHPSRALSLMSALRERLVAQLEALQVIEGRWRSLAGSDPARDDAESFFPYLSLRHGVLRRQALVNWVDECLEIIRSRSAKAGKPRAPASAKPTWLRAADPTLDSEEELK